MNERKCALLPGLGKKGTLYSCRFFLLEVGCSAGAVPPLHFQELQKGIEVHTLPAPPTSAKSGQNLPGHMRLCEARHRPAASVPERERRTSECGRRAQAFDDSRGSHGRPPDLLRAPKEGLSPLNTPQTVHLNESACSGVGVHLKWFPRLLLVSQLLAGG